jgi:hypothetical protein
MNSLRYIKSAHSEKDKKKKSEFGLIRESYDDNTEIFHTKNTMIGSIWRTGRKGKCLTGI